MPSIRFRYLLLVCGAVAVSACQAQGGAEPSLDKSAGVQASESDDAEWDVVTEAADESDPLVQHMMARREVNPTELSNRNSHVKKVEENHAKETSHFRALRLEPHMKLTSGEKVIKEEKTAEVVKPAVKPLKIDSQPLLKTAPRTIQARMTNELVGSTVVKKVRLGEHPGKTRIVLDVSEAIDFKTWLQDEDYVLIVNLPDTRVEQKMGEVLKSHPLIKAYGFQNNGRGSSQFIVTFKKPAQVSFKSALKPNSTYKDHRIVVDVRGR